MPAPLTHFLIDVSQTGCRQSEESLDQSDLATLPCSQGVWNFLMSFMVGMEEGLFHCVGPVENPDELEEERRLAYVGMTRAPYLTASKLTPAIWPNRDQST